MAKIIITENYNPNRTTKYVWEIKPDLNDMQEVERLFAKYDSDVDATGLDGSWNTFKWDKERNLYSTNFGGRETSYANHVNFNDLYDWRDDEELESLFINQFEQFEHMHNFFCARSKKCHLGQIQSDGSHAIHGVGMFNIVDFMKTFLEPDSEYLKPCQK